MRCAGLALFLVLGASACGSIDAHAGWSAGSEPPEPAGTAAAPPADAAAPDAPPPGPPAPSRWMPRPGTSWQWQLAGTLDTSLDVAAYDLDLFLTPQAVIDGLHARGKKVICYFSAGSYEPNRPDSTKIVAAVRGSVMQGWPDERWLDIRSAAVRAVMSERLAVAKSKGCDAVEPDNVDGYANATGFPLKAGDQLAFNRFLAAEAHARGMSIALKNDVDQLAELVDEFDFALNEQCFQYAECDGYAAFTSRNKAVFNVEYGATKTSVCPKAVAKNFDTILKNLALDAWRVSCR